MLRLPSIGRVVMMVVVVALVATACGGTEGTTLTGAGATFPGPFYQKAFADYSAQHPEVTVNYQSVGSGAGIQQFIKKTVDFGASDVPMKGADITAAGGADALTQIPTTLGVISIAFNISGVSALNLDADTLAQGDYGRSPLRWERHHVPLHGLPEQGLGGVEEQGGQRQVSALADRSGRQRQPGRGPGDLIDRRSGRVRRACLRRPDGHEAGGPEEPKRQVRAGKR